VGKIPEGGSTYKLGVGPELEVTDLPEPPKIRTAIDFLKWIGPAGAIALGIGIGSGEWLLAPYIVVKYGLGMLWICLIAIILQTIQNLEMARYTVLTGEPITIGLMRNRGGGKLWGTFGIIMALSQVIWPGWAGASAAAFAALQLGRLPSPTAERHLLVLWAVVTFIICMLVIVFGGKVETSLEYFFKVTTFTLLAIIIVLAIGFVPPSKWAEAGAGLVSFGYMPAGMEWVALGAMAGYAGLGGGIWNSAITNWYRDKGVGMGSKVGFIPALVGGRKFEFSPVGKFPPPTKENASRFKAWKKLVETEMWSLYFIGGLLGITLPGLLYSTYVHEPLKGWTAAAELAAGMGRVFPWAWYLLLIESILILLPTQIGCVESMVRQIVDISWFLPGVRQRFKGDIRIPYYIIIVVLWIWGIYVLATGLVAPLVLLWITANSALVSTVFLTGLGTLMLVRKLPEPYRPSVWRQVGLVAGMLFFVFFLSMSILSIAGIRL